MNAGGKDSGRDRRRPRVLITYKDLPHYRVRFYELLRERLAAQGVELQLAYGDPVGAARTRRDTRDIEWAIPVRNRTMTIAGRTLYWQPVLGLARKADLVIVEQANRLLVNYVLLGMYALGIVRLCLWGHGRNFQSANPRNLKERFKRTYSGHAHWWFAYNETSAAIVRSLGFPAERITLVQNAIDTTALREGVEGVQPEQVRSLKERLGIAGDNVCLFVGGIYEEKRIPFLIEAADVVRASLPDFELVIVGAGPDEAIAEQASAARSWVHYVGPVFDRELDPYFAMSRLVLMPGLVGLAVLDSFAAAVPMVTTDVPYHSPEIEYLVDGVNGVMVKDAESVSAYARTVLGLLTDEAARRQLIEGCRTSAREYTVENMAERFAAGVMSALEGR